MELKQDTLEAIVQSESLLVERASQTTADFSTLRIT